MQLDQIALQLYTVREQAAVDMLGTLDQVAAIGYRNVEFAGYHGVPTAALRERLDTLGLRAFSAHVGLPDLLEKTEQTIADLVTLGCAHAVVPWSAEEFRASAADVHRLASKLNEAGALVREAGMRFGYHNHAFEFAALDGSTMWDMLAENTDPALVDFQLDVFWAYDAGFNPVEVINRYAGRLPSIHIKDRAASGDDAPAGDGILPWSEILAAADHAGTTFYLVEQDNPARAMSDIARSYANLVALAR